MDNSYISIEISASSGGGYHSPRMRIQCPDFNDKTLKERLKKAACDLIEEAVTSCQVEKRVVSAFHDSSPAK